MKKYLFAAFLLVVIWLTPTSALASISAAGDLNYSSSNVTVFLNGRQLVFDQEPILVENRVLVPLRMIAESLGATVKWTKSIPQVKVQKGDSVIGLNIGSDKGFTGVRLSQVFFLEQPPVIVNGRTMVSLRFLAEALGAEVNWDEKSRCVHISAGDDMITNIMGTPGEEKPGKDKYYKLYDVLIGPDGGPRAEEAKTYVLKEGLLKTIINVQITPIRFDETGSANTMVVGNDESGREKAVWLVRNKYTGDISVTGSVLMDEVTPKDTIYSKLEEKGINCESVKKIYIAPYEKNQIYWFAMAEQDHKKYFYCFDYRTGEIVIEYNF